MTHTNQALRTILGTKRGLLVLILALVFWFPAIETRLKPVVLPLFDVSFQGVDNGTRIKASAEKLRDCDWRQTVWYLGDRQTGRAIPITDDPHRDPPMERQPGILSWDAIYIPVSPTLVEATTHADVWHSCYPILTKLGLPEYWTRSRFF